jgi:hypothetical protein
MVRESHSPSFLQKQISDSRKNVFEKSMGEESIKEEIDMEVNSNCTHKEEPHDRYSNFGKQNPMSGQ